MTTQFITEHSIYFFISQGKRGCLKTVASIFKFSGSRIKIQGRKISFGEKGIGLWNENDKKDKSIDRSG
jgi:hypothetical protein